MSSDELSTNPLPSSQVVPAKRTLGLRSDERTRMKRRVSLSDMRAIAKTRKRGIDTVLRVVAKAKRAGWPIPKIVIVGKSNDFVGVCEFGTIRISIAAFHSPWFARYVMAHELGHFRRHHGKICTTTNMLPPFVIAIPSLCFSWQLWGLSLVLYGLLRTIQLVWIARVMPRFEDEADSDAMGLVRASTFLSFRHEGTSKDRYLARRKTIMTDIAKTIEAIRRETGKAISIVSVVGK